MTKWIRVRRADVPNAFLRLFRLRHQFDKESGCRADYSMLVPNTRKVRKIISQNRKIEKSVLVMF